MLKHKRIYLLFFITMLTMVFPLMLQATYIDFAGTIAANTTWSSVDSVRVTGNVTVNNGVTLTINPGIKVSFMGHYSLNVNGRLLAVGNASNLITFTNNDHTTGWNRIIFDNTPAANDSSKIVYCTLEYGKADGSGIDDSRGGSIFVDMFSKLLISNCTFQNNTATVSGGAGGAIYIGPQSLINLMNCVFKNNTAAAGGAIRIDSNAVLKNLLIYNNTANMSQYGGGILISEANPTLLNCSIVNNTNSGIRCKSSSAPNIRNSIVYGNSDFDISVFVTEHSNPNIYYSDIQGGSADLLTQYPQYSGTYENNMNTNPLFVGSGLNPFDLQSISPCINTGDPATTASTVGIYDFGGGNRIINGRIDMGAYEELKPADTFAGHCLEFDGVEDNVSGTGISTSLSAFTIETWVYHNSLPGAVQRYVTLQPEVAVLRYDGTVYGGYRSLHFYIKKANGSGISLRADSVLVTGEWMHVAGTYDGTNLKLYVNGRLVKSTVTSGGLYPPSGTYGLSSWGETLDGKLDETRLWNYARTEAQIRENMHLPLTGGEAGLLNHWQFNASSGTSVLDIAGGCNGTMNGMTDADWVGSSIPFGSGVCYTQAESSGTMVFTGIGLTMSYTTHGTASITATKLNCAPNILPADAGDYFNSQYWIIERYGSGTFNVNMELVPNEDLTTNDQSKPNLIKLFTREGNSHGDWTLITSAYSVNEALNKARFTGIGSFSQFLIARIANQIDSNAGTALNFDGIDDYINLGNASSLGLSNIVTIEAWVKPTNLNGRQAIFSTRFNNAAGSFQLEVGNGSGGTNRIAVSGVSTWVAQTGDNAITPGEWNHIAYVRSGPGAGTHKIYVNGVLQTLISDANYSFTANNDDKLLGSGASGSQLYNGLMDEVKVWEVSLSEQAIRETMYLPLTGSESGLLSYWQFNEGLGLKLKDGISSNNGTLVNMSDTYYLLGGASWTSSGIPFGTGSVFSTLETVGVVEFPGVDLSANYTVQNGAPVTATIIRDQDVLLPVEDIVFDRQYWIMDNYGTQGFSTNLTFHLQEDITPYTSIDGEFKVYHRASSSDGAWTLYGAAHVQSLPNNTITADDITVDGQFMLAFNQVDTLAPPQNLHIVKNGGNIRISWDAVPNANVYNVYASNNPYAPLNEWTIIGLRHPGTSWDEPMDTQYEFYKVVASDQGVLLEK